MSLRITAGKFKGKEIELPPQSITRPASAKVRLALFNILQHNAQWGLESLENKIIFDGFAGSGALGFEALSRGARHAFFVESNPRVQQIIHSNARSLGVEKDITLFRCEVCRIPKATSPVDLMFLDPPYHKNLLGDSLEYLQQNHWIQEKTIIALEYAKKENFQWPDSIQSLLERAYGQTIIHIGISRL